MPLSGRAHPAEGGGMGVMMPRLKLLLVLAPFVIPPFLLVNHIVPHPYMDEIFHVPQAQSYCRGDYSKWDSNITTFPGLYIVSVAEAAVLFPAMRVMGMASSIPDLCTVAYLRSVNVVLYLICGLLFYEILLELDPQKRTMAAFAKATILSLYPVHWFFTFLYYTDMGSTAAVLGTYLACLKKAYWTSALLAILAIFFRQTNAVWTLVMMCFGVLECLHQYSTSTPMMDKKQDGSFAAERKQSNTEDIVRSTKEKLRKRHDFDSKKEKGLSSSTIRSSLDSEDKTHFSFEGLCKESLLLVEDAWRKRQSLCWNFCPMLLVIFIFILFVVYNGGIVVGAKDAHKVSLHFSQLLYFGGLSALGVFPIHFFPAKVVSLLKFAKSLKRRNIAMMGAAGFILMFLVAHYSSFAHPYLLADNRHYTFYLWRKVIQAHWSAKYYLIPFYMYSWCSLLESLGRTQRWPWLLVLCFGITAVIVPAPLIEFRYYTIPFFMMAIHSWVERYQEKIVWFVILMQFLAVNAFTLFMFLFKSFSWAHEPGVQRFMW